MVKISLKSDKNWGNYSQFNIQTINAAYKIKYLAPRKTRETLYVLK